MDKYENVLLVCNLNEILLEKRMSVNKLANDINERRSTINDLKNNKEMDKRQIPARLIAKLCSYLDVKPSDLFEVKTFNNL